MGGAVGSLLFFAVAIALVVIIGRKGQKHTDTEVQAFAQANGYSFDPKPDKAATIDEAIFTKKFSLTLRDLVVMPSGRKAVKIYVSSVGAAGIPFLASITPSPEIQVSFDLLPKVSSGRFGFDTGGLQPYQLEGSLAQLYDLYIQPGTEVEALSLLQPDTLLQLVQGSPDSVVIARPGYLYFLYRNPDAPQLPEGQTPSTGIHILPAVSYEQQFQKLTVLTDMILQNVHRPAPPLAPSDPAAEVAGNLPPPTAGTAGEP